MSLARLGPVDGLVSILVAGRFAATVDGLVALPEEGVDAGSVCFFVPAPVPEAFKVLAGVLLVSAEIEVLLSGFVPVLVGMAFTEVFLFLGTAEV